MTAKIIEYDILYILFCLFCGITLWFFYNEASNFQNDFWECKCTDTAGIKNYDGIKLNNTSEIFDLEKNKKRKKEINNSVCLLWGIKNRLDTH